MFDVSVRAMIDADGDRGAEDGRGGGKKQRSVGADGGVPDDGQGIPGRLTRGFLPVVPVMIAAFAALVAVSLVTRPADTA